MENIHFVLSFVTVIYLMYEPDLVFDQDNTLLQHTQHFFYAGKISSFLHGFYLGLTNISLYPTDISSSTTRFFTYIYLTSPDKRGIRVSM